MPRRQPGRCGNTARGGKGTSAVDTAIAINADRHTRDLAPVIAGIRAAGGHTSLRAIAAELEAHGMLTRRGGVAAGTSRR